MGAAYDGKIHPRKMRLARQAEARLVTKKMQVSYQLSLKLEIKKTAFIQSCQLIFK